MANIVSIITIIVCLGSSVYLGKNDEFWGMLICLSLGLINLGLLWLNLRQ